ncbi:sugar phosphate nucleotidyltransferase, partial [Escherichia coli]|uniref:sugar phosphate nucleotidyltransferase n=1 Tax=Escherichia coli TaxID=562 RepID=UPI003D00E3DA
TKSMEFHRSHGKAATLTATYPPGRFGALHMEDGRITDFMEKPQGDGGMINGGFFVLSPSVIDLIDDDSTTWEQEPLKTLAARGELMAYEH